MELISIPPISPTPYPLSPPMAPPPIVAASYPSYILQIYDIICHGHLTVARRPGCEPTDNFCNLRLPPFIIKRYYLFFLITNF